MDATNGKLSAFVNKNILPLALGLIGLIFFICGMIPFSAPEKNKSEISFEAASDGKPTGVAKKELKEIIIDVEGAVMKPGVYRVHEDSRMQDALIAAGGMSDDADRTRVAKSLNLASKMSDGTKVYIPFIGESDTLVEAASGGGPSTLEGDAQSSGRININNASSDELDSLPGVGPVTVEKIIDNRPYASVEELLEKKIVGKSTFEKIKDQIGI